MLIKPAACSPATFRPSSALPSLRRDDRSGREIGCVDLDSVGMERPVAQRLLFAEFLLCQLPGIAFIGGVDFQRPLTNFHLPAVLAEHVLHEPNDKPRHETSYWSQSRSI